MLASQPQARATLPPARAHARYILECSSVGAGLAVPFHGIRC
eukprot:COSAG06_NODE_3829_length_4860_cov_9.798750_5_plen_41_part_01